jgi:hypothetical protein
MIQETITGNTPSSETNPTQSVSDCIVDITGCKRSVVLQVKAPNTTWREVTRQTGAYSLLTPDNNLSYRFQPLNLEGDCEVYFGA